MFTGRTLTAEEAREAGLVTRLVEASLLERHLEEIKGEILKAPLDSLRLAKRCIDRGLELDPKGALEEEIKAIDEQLAAGQWMGRK
jgi:enoyl-CoA hydratase